MKYNRESKLGSIFQNEEALEILKKYVPEEILFSPLAEMAMNETLQDIQREASEIISLETLNSIELELKNLN